MPLEKRLLNVASEITRAKNLAAEDAGLARQSVERALDLVDLTVESVRGQSPVYFMRELLRLREILAGEHERPDRAVLESVLRGLLDLNPETHNLGLEI